MVYTYSTPLLSGLMARLLIDLTVGKRIPITIRDQALWWTRHYHQSVKSTIFEEKVKKFEDEKSQCFNVSFKIIYADEICIATCINSCIC